MTAQATTRPWMRDREQRDTVCPSCVDNPQHSRPSMLTQKPCNCPHHYGPSLVEVLHTYFLDALAADDARQEQAA